MHMRSITLTAGIEQRLLSAHGFAVWPVQVQICVMRDVLNKVLHYYTWQGFAARERFVGWLMDARLLSSTQNKQKMLGPLLLTANI
jgi:hypothetical protein